VPAGAIIFDCDGLHALLVENGVAKSRKITQIRDLGTGVEVGDGDKVVLLRKAAKVRLWQCPEGANHQWRRVPPG
jgi:hypothetical protein